VYRSSSEVGCRDFSKRLAVLTLEEVGEKREKVEDLVEDWKVDCRGLPSAASAAASCKGVGGSLLPLAVPPHCSTLSEGSLVTGGVGFGSEAARRL
jgi:hypothetical protein